MLDNYAKLLTMYKDSATVWGAELEKKKGGDLSAIAVKYGASSAIREEPQAIGSYHYKETVVDYEAIRQTIWEQAFMPPAVAFRFLRRATQRTPALDGCPRLQDTDRRSESR